MTGRIKLTYTQMTFRNKLSLNYIIPINEKKSKARLDTHYNPRIREVGAENGYKFEASTGHIANTR